MMMKKMNKAEKRGLYGTAQIFRQAVQRAKNKKLVPCDGKSEQGCNPKNGPAFA